MWICKYCEMQNNDWETECFLCGKPLKEPEPVAEKEEKKKTPPTNVADNPAYREVQPDEHEPLGGFEFHIDSDEIYEEYDPFEVSIEAEEFENVTDEQEIEREEPADEVTEPQQPDYSRFATALGAVFSTELTEKEKQVREQSPQSQEDKKKEPSYLARMFEYTEGEAPKTADTTQNAEATKVADATSRFYSGRSTPAQQNAAAEAEGPAQPFVYGAVTDTSAPKPKEVRLEDLLEIIQNKDSDSITEEIRRKQEKQKKQQPADDVPQKKAQKRAVKKENLARQRQETVAMVSKMMVVASRVVVVVFSLLTLLYIGMSAWSGYADNAPYMLDEIFYMFELQLREVLESMKLGF